jgi:voltage-gated potassium channel
MKITTPLAARYRKFVNEPASIKNAAWLIAAVTLMSVLLGALVMWVLDRPEYETYGDALWFTLQTVTTVGYGDVTPTSGIGQTVAAIVMLTAIAFTTVVTAAITSSFVAAAQAKRADEQQAQDESDLQRLEDALEAINRRLDGIEDELRRQGGESDAGSDDAG